MKKPSLRQSFLSVACAICALTSFTTFNAYGEEVNLYSYRKEVLIRPLIDGFTKKTGITVNIVSGDPDALLERLKSEGMNSPADLLLSADAGRLIRAQEANVLQSISSEELNKLIPSQFKDPDGYWFGLSLRSRVIFYAKDRVKAEELSTYEALAAPKWNERICIRSSGSVYNQSLLASLIVHNGAEKSEEWAKAMVANFARKPQGGDRDQIKAVASGECDIAVGNTYYYGSMLTSQGDEKKAAQAVSLFWPNQQDRGAHVNISGGGVTKSAKHKEAAIKFLEYLASDEAQNIYANEVFEFPIRKSINPSPLVAQWGTFKADKIELSKFAAHQEDALKIFDRVGWR
jgi:iron(III) transport system substrate-binding protein